MDLAGGLLARSHDASDSGASGNFCARNARFVGTIDDFVFLSRWATRIPSVDDARVVVGLCDRLVAVPRIDSAAIATCYELLVAIANPLGQGSPPTAKNSPQVVPRQTLRHPPRFLPDNFIPFVSTCGGWVMDLRSLQE
jgi:hypothetical protein